MRNNEEEIDKRDCSHVREIRETTRNSFGIARQRQPRQPLEVTKSQIFVPPFASRSGGTNRRIAL